MKYQVKDYYGNLIQECEDTEALYSYISSSKSITSSAGDTELILNYFQYDSNLLENLSSSLSSDENVFNSFEDDLNSIRVIYTIGDIYEFPKDDDDILE